jgi:hypothetical protein
MITEFFDQVKAKQGKDDKPVKTNGTVIISPYSPPTPQIDDSEEEGSLEQINSSTPKKVSTQKRIRGRGGATVHELKNKTPTNDVQKKSLKINQ